jgi:ABC-2 type transport system permease protein
MTSLRQTWEIARRDLTQRARSRAFLVSTGLIVLLVLAIGPLLASTINDPPPQEIGVVGTLEKEFEAATGAAATAFNLNVRFTEFPSLETAEAALLDGAVRVVVTEDGELVWRKEPNQILASVIGSALQAVDRGRTIEELGITPEEAAAIITPAPPVTRSLETPDPNAEPRRIAALVGAFVMYMAILMFGQFVMLGVLEEKSNRVVEVVLSRVQPYQILTGKVIGIGLLGLGQLIVLSGAVIVTLTMVDIADIDLAGIGAGLFARIVFWFLLGYAFFSVLYASMGALVSRQEDAMSAGMIPILLMLPGYFFSLIASSDPEVLAVRIFSLIPPTSPMVMPIRSSVTDVPAREIALSIVLILAAVYGMIRIGGRVYRGGVLQIGAKVRIREAWRAAER